MCSWTRWWNQESGDLLGDVEEEEEIWLSRGEGNELGCGTGQGMSNGS